MEDYNKMFNTNFSTHNFDGYFRDICKRIKNTEIDIVIVVNMLLTGFDAKRLNTLYVDKPLKYHDLIQAFSRTNRVESDTKPFGNIVCYRTTKARVDEAVKLFSQTDSIDTVIMAPYDTYLEKFNKAVDKLLSITPTVESVDSLEREEDIKEFIIAFREVAKVLVSLKTFNQFDLDTDATTINAQIFEDYKSKYYELYRKLSNDKEKSSILNDVTFSLELIQTDRINVSYILNLIRNVDLTNEEQKQKDIEDIEAKLVNVINNLKKFADEYKGTTCLGYTHFQPAQLTTVGKRATLWMQDLLEDLEELEFVESRMKLLGCKGTTGTQESFMKLFKDEEKVKQNAELFGCIDTL